MHLLNRVFSLTNLILIISNAGHFQVNLQGQKPTGKVKGRRSAGPSIARKPKFLQ